MKKIFILGVLSVVVLGFIGCEKPINEPSTVEDCENKYSKLKENLEKEVEGERLTGWNALMLDEYNSQDKKLCIKKVNCKGSTERACKKIMEAEYKAPEFYIEVGIKYK
ncbi:MAG: hypothetical protein LBT96_01930 [Campylobacteraceae bacterium]|jgi:hypothetical protein|nr:hypothetical protein [Campylobacteraceae bacterium]